MSTGRGDIPDPYSDFTLPEDADLVSSPMGEEAEDGHLDDDPVGEDD